MTRRLAFLLLALALSLVAAPVAVADDKAVADAWVAHDSEYKQHNAALRKNAKSNRSPREKATRAMEIFDAVRKTLAKNQAHVKAQQPSSEHGADAKSFILKSNALADLVFINRRKAWRAYRDGNDAKSERYDRRADKYMKRGDRYTAKAEAALRRAGV